MAHNVRLGDQGRVVIPAAARRALGLLYGDHLSVRVEEDHLIVERQGSALGRLRQQFATVPGTVSLSDELIADRRREGRQDHMGGSLSPCGSDQKLQYSPHSDGISREGAQRPVI